jgi:hypothetical protein
MPLGRPTYTAISSVKYGDNGGQWGELTVEECADCIGYYCGYNMVIVMAFSHTGKS